MKWWNTTKDIKKPRCRNLYAVKHGDHAGKFLAYIQSSKDTHHFLTIPGNECLEIPIADFENGIDNKIVDFVEIIPRSVFKVVKAQYFS